jgi:hypothetical protein
MDSDIRELFVACADYMQLVVEKIGYEKAIQRGVMANILARFLFPQFDEAPLQDRLARLIQMHDWAEASLNGRVTAQSLGHDEEQLTNAQLCEMSEREFRKCKDAVLNTPEIMNVLTPIQRRMLDQYYFKLRLDESR